MSTGTTNFLVVIVLVGWGVLHLVESNNENDRKEAAKYHEEQAWKEPIIRNCENAVMRISDAATVQLARHDSSLRVLYPDEIGKTENGYVYTVRASDSTTTGGWVRVACYTQVDGKVIRLVPGN